MSTDIRWNERIPIYLFKYQIEITKHTFNRQQNLLSTQVGKFNILRSEKKLRTDRWLESDRVGGSKDIRWNERIPIWD